MKQQMPYIITLIILVVGTSSFLCLYYFKDKPLASIPEIVRKEAKTGDIIFTEGYSLKSDIVRLTGGHRSRISHTGFIQRKEAEIYVTHMSIDKDVIISEQIDSFIKNNTVLGYTIMRLSNTCDTTILTTVLDSLIQIKIPFDNEYSMQSEDTYYCTELICKVSQTAGYNLMADITYDTYLYPSELVLHPFMKQVYTNINPQ